MTHKLITMSHKELSKYEMIMKLIYGKMNGPEVSKILRLSVRHIRRLKARVKKHGAKALIHGNRGKPGNRRMPEEKIFQIEKIVKEKYYDFGPTFASEKLEEEHKIEIGKETLRQRMICWNVWKPKSRKTNKEYRSWRPRKEYFGEMQQFDGSYERWFEKRAPECCLVASIDDATGRITGLKFVADEGVKPVFGFWQDYIKKYGKPISIYLDRYSTYKQNQRSVFDDPCSLTQFERAMRDLGIQIIHAHSPQAKGRIEKLFGTLQDRLIKELRLKNISSIQEANIFVGQEFIPRFNEKFSVLPQKKKNLHGKLTIIDTKNLDRIFSIHHPRKVNNDFTVQYQGRWFQLDEIQPTLVLRKDRVRVEERINGDININLREKYLHCKELPKRPEKVYKMKVAALTKTKPLWKPPLNHPWRKQFFFSKSKVEQPTTLTH